MPLYTGYDVYGVMKYKAQYKGFLLKPPFSELGGSGKLLPYVTSHTKLLSSWRNTKT
jgi:hypothetical protein